MSVQGRWSGPSRTGCRRPRPFLRKSRTRGRSSIRQPSHGNHRPLPSAATTSPRRSPPRGRPAPACPDPGAAYTAFIQWPMPVRGNCRGTLPRAQPTPPAPPGRRTSAPRQHHRIVRRRHLLEAEAVDVRRRPGHGVAAQRPRQQHPRPRILKADKIDLFRLLMAADVGHGCQNVVDALRSSGRL